MKNFTQADVKNPDSEFPHIYSEGTNDLIDSPLPWQKLGLQETSSGYGAKLTCRYKIQFEGKNYRIYITCFSNAGSSWFKVKGKKIYLS